MVEYVVHVLRSRPHMTRLSPIFARHSKLHLEVVEVQGLYDWPLPWLKRYFTIAAPSLSSHQDLHLEMRPDVNRQSSPSRELFQDPVSALPIAESKL